MFKYYYLYHMLDSFIMLLKSPLRLSKKVRLFLVWSKINYKYFFLSPFIEFKSEKFLGMTVNFFSYETFRYLFEEIFIRGEYYFFSKNTKPTIFDCGANIGMTVLFFKWLYPGSSIFAFEPNLSSFAVLESNILKNKLSNVKLENVAIGNKNSKIFFYSDPNDPGSVVASTKKTRAQTFRTSVAEIKLSSYIKRNKIAIIHFLKMDIEGSEFESIIELSNNKALGLIYEMIVEYHHNIKKNNSSLAKLLLRFEKLNFRYQMYSKPIPLYKKNVFQDILLYIYR